MGVPKDKPHRSDFFGGLIICLVSLFFIISSLRMPWKHLNWSQHSAPGLVPMVLAISLLVMGGYQVLRSLLGRPRAQASGSPDAPAPEERRQSRFQMLVTMLLSAGYVVALGKVPYAVATFAFLLAFVLIFGQYRPLRALLYAAAVTACVVIVFQRLFLIPLP